MMQRRTFLGGAAAVGALAGLGMLAGCTAGTKDPNQIRLWGVGGDQRPVEKKIIEAYGKVAPNISVVNSTVPSNGTGDATSIITAVRGGTAPDLWYMDAFSCAQYASLGLLESITPLIEKYEDSTFLDQWLQFSTDSLSLNGQVYGLPMDTDTRVLYYNKKLLRAVGVDLDEFDPKNGPPTIERVLEISQKMTKKDGRGNYTRLGLIPWDGEAWAYTWSLGNQATFFDDSNCSIDLTAKPILDAYTFLYDQAREMDFGKVDAFKATYEPPNHPPAQTSFQGEQQGFLIAQPIVNSLKKYVPNLDYGYTYLPVPKKGAKPYTWSGGFSLVAPKGASMTKEMWDFMKFYCGKPGQEIYMPAVGAVPTQRDVLKSTDPAITSLGLLVDQLKFSTSRPPFPVSQIWWDSMAQAQDSVKLGTKTPIEALETAQARVAPQMELYCPFKLPKGFGRTGV
ncbi:ABC transporter substrate-binding protein [Lacisediminihabitans sp.]|uniref:ABC transporter substrate-binding protein n=1 Tax=Lacisediminihabitans sp. TaxID=2787631 RepID=UPI00374CAB4C